MYSLSTNHRLRQTFNPSDPCFHNHPDSATGAFGCLFATGDLSECTGSLFLFSNGACVGVAGVLGVVDDVSGDFMDPDDVVVFMPLNCVCTA